MNKKQNIYKTLLDLSQQILHKRQLPIYSSRFSRKDFTTYQLTSLLVIKTYENKGYRAFVDWLQASHIPKILRLNKLPHFTTLQKFASRLVIQQLEKLLLASGLLAKKQCQHAGIDATGFSLRHASRHYEKRVGIHVHKKDFLKVTIAADLDNQLIFATKLRKKSRHDTKDFMPIWNKIWHIPFRWWYADKGYDAEPIFAQIEQSEKISFGCIRQKTKEWHRMKGKCRRRALKYSIYRKKNWRSLVETINSVIKRRFGSVVYARNWHTMKIELLLKLITYNLYRLTTKNLVNLALLLCSFYATFRRLLLQSSPLSSLR